MTHADPSADQPAEAAPAPHPGGRPSKYDPAYCEMVVEAMAEGFSLTAFAGIVGVARSTLNEWMAAYPEFSEAVSRAKAARLLHWERTALNVAAKGSGGPGAATVIVFGLKNMGGDEWSDTSRTEVTGKNGGALQIETKPDLSDLTQEERDVLRGIAERRLGKSSGNPA